MTKKRWILVGKFFRSNHQKPNFWSMFTKCLQSSDPRVTANWWVVEIRPFVAPSKKPKFSKENIFKAQLRMFRPKIFKKSIQVLEKTLKSEILRAVEIFGKNYEKVTKKGPILACFSGLSVGNHIFIYFSLTFPNFYEFSPEHEFTYSEGCKPPPRLCEGTPSPIFHT